MELEAGLRVVRGPDWSYGDQDGGEGHVGTVAEVEEAIEGVRCVKVQWDCGNRARHLCGVDDKYDLRVLDSAPTGRKHLVTLCQGCRDPEIAGVLWQCVVCHEHYLCTPCYMMDKHSLEHQHLRIDGSDRNCRTWVQPRARSQKVKVMGIFHSALVVRGYNWKWGNQDGGEGNVGEVLDVLGEKDSARCVVQVRWGRSNKKNNYRLGLKGKVDLRLAPDGARSIGHYYPDHLAVLGAPHIPPKGVQVAAGDRVTVELDPDVWKSLQEGHGGWNDLMSMFIGTIGTVVQIHDSGDLVVNFFSNAMFHINGAAATKVESPVLSKSNVVRVIDDMEEVRKMQKGHGEWNETMADSLGQIGKVLKVLPSGDIRVAVGGKRWIYNPHCLQLAPGETPTLDIDENYVNHGLRLQLQPLLDQMNPDLVPLAAAAGDAMVLKQYLSKSPNEINTKHQGKSALHVAITEGFLHILKILLGYNPDLNIMDNDGDTPLHYCAHSNEDQAAKLLLNAGADPNLKNGMGLFPMALATALGQYRVLTVIANHPGVDLQAQDTEQNTALHIAVTAHRNKAVTILLDAGAVLSSYNSLCFSPILEAAKNGFYAGMEQFITYHPEHVNMLKSDDGHTPLHIAAANNHLDLACLLASLKTCDLNAKNFLIQLTPLHIAAQRGHSRILEHLIGYGADPNAKDGNGLTVLHIVVANAESEPPTPDTPELQKVEKELVELSEGKTIEPYITVACFLISEGADMHEMNLLGVSPIQICQEATSALVKKFADRREEYDRRQFYGSKTRIDPDSLRKGIGQRPQVENVQPSSPDASVPVVSKNATSGSPLPPDHSPTIITQSSPAHVVSPSPATAHVVSPSLATVPPAHVVSPSLATVPPAHVVSPSPATAHVVSPSLATVPPAHVVSSSPATVPMANQVYPLPEQTSTPQTAGTETSSNGLHDNEDGVCPLCGKLANIKFSPCGHIVLCSQCAKPDNEPAVKKCPRCKVCSEII